MRDNKIKCKHCEKEVNEDFIYCPYCGEKLDNKIVCPKCKKEIPNSAHYCRYCGHSFLSNKSINASKITQILLHLFTLAICVTFIFTLLFAPIYHSKIKARLIGVEFQVKINYTLFDMMDTGSKLVEGYTYDDLMNSKEMLEYLLEIDEYGDRYEDSNDVNVKKIMRDLERITNRHNPILLDSFDVESMDRDSNYVQHNYVTGAVLLLQGILILTCVLLLCIVFVLTLLELLHKNKGKSTTFKLSGAVFFIALAFCCVIQCPVSTTTTQDSGVFIALTVLLGVGLILQIIKECLCKERKISLSSLLIHGTSMIAVIVVAALAVRGIVRLHVTQGNYYGTAIMDAGNLFAFIDNTNSRLTSEAIESINILWEYTSYIQLHLPIDWIAPCLLSATDFSSTFTTTFIIINSLFSITSGILFIAVLIKKVKDLLSHQHTLSPIVLIGVSLLLQCTSMILYLVGNKKLGNGDHMKLFTPGIQIIVLSITALLLIYEIVMHCMKNKFFKKQESHM